MRERCTFCNGPATEWHHIAGRNNSSWFCVPLCTQHHQVITRAYYAANPNMMKRATHLSDRIKHAREGCCVFLWLLDHPEQIDPKRLLK